MNQNTHSWCWGFCLSFATLVVWLLYPVLDERVGPTAIASTPPSEAVAAVSLEEQMMQAVHEDFSIVHEFLHESIPTQGEDLNRLLRLELDLELDQIETGIERGLVAMGAWDGVPVMVSVKTMLSFEKVAREADDFDPSVFDDVSAGMAGLVVVNLHTGRTLVTNAIIFPPRGMGMLEEWCDGPEFCLLVLPITPYIWRYTVDDSIHGWGFERLFGSTEDYLRFIRPRFPASARIFDHFEENSLSWPDMCMQCPNGASWCPWADMQPGGPLSLAKETLDECQFLAKGALTMCMLGIAGATTLTVALCKASLPGGPIAWAACLGFSGATLFAAHWCYRDHSLQLRDCLLAFAADLEARYAEVCDARP